MTQYRAVVGIDYPPNQRAEAGDLISDLPEKSAKWLLDQGLIELPDGKNQKVEPTVKAKTETAFDPNAVDADKDGFVQDGTEFQRPVEETN
jgi:hypothetical protein